MKRSSKRSEIRRLNDAIDRALRDPSEPTIRVLLDHPAAHNAPQLSERVRRRAALLDKSDPHHGNQILSARDTLIFAIYRHAAPKGWYTGWCDASVRQRIDGRFAGIGGILMDAQGKIVVEFGRFAGALDSFEAEIAALVALLQVSVARGAERVRVYTDCVALVLLWHQRRRDPRLAPVLELMRKFRGAEIRFIPRQHNQPAHTLAKTAALPVSSSRGFVI